MKTCPNCGVQNLDHNQFCTFCGSPLAEQPAIQLCPKCGNTLQLTDSKCPVCGAPQLGVPNFYTHAVPNRPAQKQKKSKLPLIIGIVAVGAAVLILFILLLFSLFGPDSSASGTQTSEASAQAAPERNEVPEEPETDAVQEDVPAVSENDTPSAAADLLEEPAASSLPESTDANMQRAQSQATEIYLNAYYGKYRETDLPSGATAYWDGDSLILLYIPQDESYGYDRYLYMEDGDLFFAHYFSSSDSSAVDFFLHGADISTILVYEHSQLVDQYETEEEWGKWPGYLFQYYDLYYHEAMGLQDGPSASANTPEPFYGIWCQATKNEENALEYLQWMTEFGYDARMITTTDWSNLNSTTWYVITAGVYGTKEEAESCLADVQAVYPDAYVKYSGEYIGQ